MPISSNRLRRLLNNPRVIAAAALGCSAASAMLACSADRATAPSTLTAAVRADKSAGDSAEPVADTAKRDVKDDDKGEAKAEHDLDRAQLDSLKDDREAYERSVKRTNVKADLLRCEPQPSVRETRTIGPNGGTLRVGPHRLVIPAGALAQNVAITGTVPANAVVNVEFAPHGLQFSKPVEMTIDYKQCVVPDSEEIGVTYMLPGWRAAEKMPSSDARKDKKITALTDHFSGYVVTWTARAW